jgi:quercetin 2,3-dioxygenase
MITLRRGSERHHTRRAGREVSLEFFGASVSDPAPPCFGTLEILAEARLAVGASIPRIPMREAEIVTYVREGALAWDDSVGCSGVLHAGEFEHLCAARATRHREHNPSRTDGAQIFQVWLRPSLRPEGSRRDQRRFSTAERSGQLRLIASPDGRQGSLRLSQDALLYSAVFDSGHHEVYPLGLGRLAWLQILSGSASLRELNLRQGDGAGVTEERAVSFTAGAGCEVLLLDLPDRPAAPWVSDSQ